MEASVLLHGVVMFLVVGPQALPTLLKVIIVRKCAYPSLIVHSPKRPWRTQGELMDATNPLICQHLWWTHFLLLSLLVGSVFIGSSHLKSYSSRIMGRSFSYEMLRGVRLAWFDYCCPPCPLPICLYWLVALELLAESFLAGRLVTRTYWVAAQTSSSSKEYLFAHLNKSFMVVRGFLARDSKERVPG